MLPTLKKGDSLTTDTDNRDRYVEPNRRKQIEEILRKLGRQII
ncbi:MAG: hypothetical protein NW214_17020 [Pseudanabaenaceae cyanobacterium bins.39]|nr:hypothetical protein [Pseudanabaenaceae cyanobacterium bins.39]